MNDSSHSLRGSNWRSAATRCRSPRSRQRHKGFSLRLPNAEARPHGCAAAIERGNPCSRPIVPRRLGQNEFRQVERVVASRAPGGLPFHPAEFVLGQPQRGAGLRDEHERVGCIVDAVEREMQRDFGHQPRRGETPVMRGRDQKAQQSLQVQRVRRTTDRELRRRVRAQPVACRVAQGAIEVTRS